MNLVSRSSFSDRLIYSQKPTSFHHRRRPFEYRRTPKKGCILLLCFFDPSKPQKATDHRQSKGEFSRETSRKTKSTNSHNATFDLTGQSYMGRPASAHSNRRRDTSNHQYFGSFKVKLVPNYFTPVRRGKV